MSSTQYLTDVATRHSVFIQRYGAGRSKEALAMLNRLRNDINARLSQEPTAFQRQRLMLVMDDINKLSYAAFGDISNKILYDARKLSTVEADYSQRLFNKATTIDWVLPASSVIANSVMASKMSINKSSSITIEDALKQFSMKKRQQIATTITDSLTLGDTTPVISQKISGLINTLQRRQLDTLVRTVANNVSSAARNVLYEANTDIIEGFQWISTLDASTSLICASRDHIIYRQPNSPKPPAHWNCRSTTIPAIKPEYDIGTKLRGNRPAVGAGGAENVNPKKGYGGWLKGQPPEFQNEALGIERAKLFRSGALKINDFVDPTGRVYTLSELANMHPISMIE